MTEQRRNSRYLNCNFCNPLKNNKFQKTNHLSPGVLQIYVKINEFMHCSDYLNP